MLTAGAHVRVPPEKRGVSSLFLSKEIPLEFL